MRTTPALALLCLLGVAGSLIWLALPRDNDQSKQSSSERLENHDEATSITLANFPERFAGNHSFGPAKRELLPLAVERLRDALNGEDEAEIEAAFQFLAELLKEDPEKVHELFAVFEAETEPRLITSLARLIGPHFSPENTALFERALALAQTDELPEKRSAALLLLSSVRHPKPELLDFMFQVSRQDVSSAVRLQAIQVIGQWAEDSRQWDHLSRELVKTVDASADNQVRGYAIQVIALYSGITQDDVLGSMAAYLKEDPSPQNRAIAALAIGRVPDELRASALDHLGQAFARESTIDTRRNILTQIARAGREQAIPVFQSLPANHPILVQDIHDYIEILGAGDVEGDEIYNRKFARDAERGTIVGAYGYYDPPSPQTTP